MSTGCSTPLREKLRIYKGTLKRINFVGCLILSWKEQQSKSYSLGYICGLVLCGSTKIVWLWRSKRHCLYSCRFQMLSALSPVPESASPGHFYMSAFGPQGHLSASSEHGNGWRTLGTSTCPNTRDRVSPKNEHHLKKNCSWKQSKESKHTWRGSRRHWFGWSPGHHTLSAAAPPAFHQI